MIRCKELYEANPKEKQISISRGDLFILYIIYKLNGLKVVMQIDSLIQLNQIRVNYQGKT